jgi:hypothetical protein
MPADNRTTEQVRGEIETERERLAEAVDQLREGMGEATKLRSNLPLAGAAALAAGFFVAGGIGATARLIFRRGREGDKKARVGRFTFLDRG